VPQLTIREGGKRKQIYLTREQREEVERIKFANGLRSLKEAYEVWKEAKERLASTQYSGIEDGVRGVHIVDNSEGDSEELWRLRRENKCLRNQLEDPDVDLMLKLDEELLDLRDQFRSLQNENATLKANIKAVRKQNEDLRRYGTRPRPRRKRNDNDQQAVSEFWPQVKEEAEGD